jgi:hypothetical protein
MAGSIEGHPPDRLTDGPRSRLAEPPPPAEVEAELQRIARQRSDRATDDAAAHGHRNSRSLRHRRQPLAGGFDSPAGFAFGSGEVDHKR